MNARTLALLSLGVLACGDTEAIAPPPVTPAPPVPAPAPTTPPADAAPPTPSPPVAMVRTVTDTYFGKSVPDPYRWMEDPKSTELPPWMKAQADFTRATIDALPIRATFAGRIKELDHAGDRVSGTQKWADHYFYSKRPAGKELAKYCVRDAPNGAERVLIDPETLQTADGKHYALDYAQPSPDGTLVAYGISIAGSEDSVLHVLDVATGKDLSDQIDRAQFGGVSWIDAKRFFYTRLAKPAAGAPQTEKYKRSTAMLHTLGTDAEKDEVILGVDVTKEIPVRDVEIPFVLTTSESKYVFAYPADGVRNESSLWYAPKSALNGAKTPWKKIYDVKDDVTSFDIHGDDLYGLSHKDALRFKVMHTSLTRPDWSKADVVVPESELVIRAIGTAKDALYLRALDAGIGRLLRVPYARHAKVETIPVGVDGSLGDLFTIAKSDGALFTAESWTSSPRVDEYDPKISHVVDTQIVAPSPVNFSGIASEEVRVKSKDGTMVPLSIVYPKTFTKDGSRPLWLEGYGAYGYTLEPEFIPRRRALFERDAAFAACHVRGGGELGEGWHKNGMLLNKQHSIDDFVACAEWLVANKYSSVAKIAGEGTSAGGIVIGGAITQRPELFAVAFVRVGWSNAIRVEQSENVLNVAELGTVATEDGFRALYAQDAYVHVKDGTAYPAVMLTTGVNDPRVAPWQVTKMAARLQAATSSKKPVLLRVDYDAGHGLGSTAAQRDEEYADELAFLFWQAGEPTAH